MIWDKAQFKSDSTHITYGAERRFVARFKYKNAPITKAMFIQQLMKTTTPDEYFAELGRGKAPLQILIERDQKWYDSAICKFYGKPREMRFDNRIYYREFVGAA